MKTTAEPEVIDPSEGPWALIEGDIERRDMSRIVKAHDREFLIGYALCDSNRHQRKEDLANGRCMAYSRKMYGLLRSITASTIAHGCIDGKPVKDPILPPDFQAAALDIIAQIEGRAK